MQKKEIFIHNLGEDISNIEIMLARHNNMIKSYINEAYDDGYEKGFEQGILRGSELTLEEMDIDNLDMDSIRVFAAFCYVNGIDFSYMGKSDDLLPFTERVIIKFKECIANNDISIEAYKEKLKKDEEMKAKYRINCKCRHTPGCKGECLCKTFTPCIAEVDYDTLPIDVDPELWKKVSEATFPMDIIAQSINENNKMDARLLLDYYNKYLKESSNTKIEADKEKKVKDLFDIKIEKPIVIESGPKLPIDVDPEVSEAMFPMDNIMAQSIKENSKIDDMVLLDYCNKYLKE